MLRMVFVVLTTMPYIIYYVMKAKIVERHDGYFSEERRYRMAIKCMRIMMRHGAIRTVCTGQENLPSEGGYVMYSNHQGKFDTVGIMVSHPRPCTIVMDYYRSQLPIVNPFIDLVKGKRLDKTDMKSQVKTIMQIVEEVKQGRRYIVFPEGGYTHNRNTLQPFMAGSFKCATKAKAPIVPVAILDSYKPFNTNSLKPVKTQVHFLEPIYYNQYKEMTTQQIADLVKSKIADELEKQLQLKNKKRSE